MEVTESKLFEALGRLYVTNQLLVEEIVRLRRPTQNGTGSESVEEAEVIAHG